MFHLRSHSEKEYHPLGAIRRHTTGAATQMNQTLNMRQNSFSLLPPVVSVTLVCSAGFPDDWKGNIQQFDDGLEVAVHIHGIVYTCQGILSEGIDEDCLDRRVSFDDRCLADTKYCVGIAVACQNFPSN